MRIFIIELRLLDDARNSQSINNFQAELIMAERNSEICLIKWLQQWPDFPWIRDRDREIAARLRLSDSRRLERCVSVRQQLFKHQQLLIPQWPFIIIMKCVCSFDKNAITISWTKHSHLFFATLSSSSSSSSSRSSSIQFVLWWNSIFNFYTTATCSDNTCNYKVNRAFFRSLNSFVCAYICLDYVMLCSIHTEHLLYWMRKIWLHQSGQRGDGRSH